MAFNFFVCFGLYVLIGIVMAYLIASYYPRVNDRKDMMLGEFIKFCIASAALWPFMVWLMLYETYIEGRHLTRKTFIKYRGK